VKTSNLNRGTARIMGAGRGGQAGTSPSTIFKEIRIERE
jgi:hypothetical protein